MIMVVGADGFIGRKLVNKLCSSHKVLAVDKQFSNLFKDDIQTTLCDITQFQSLEAIFKKHPIRIVVHLASLLNSRSNQDPSLATQVNIFGSLNLLNLSKTYNVEKFIYGSSISIYGPLPSSNNNPVDETTAVKPINIYGDTKNYVESLGKAYKSQYKLDFVSLRISTVVGKGVKNSSSPWRSQIFELEETQNIEIPMQEDEKLPMVHVDDVVDQIEILISNQNAHDIYNTPSETIRLEEIASVVNRKYPQKRLIFGTKRVNDIPHYIDGKLFEREFDYSMPSIIERLQGEF